ncbi:MAG: hypothetical protein RM368_09240 [Nostoc sp. DedSLP03]|uniref:hypothetical protein n=1 Tax=Nostoc sp. DedSLP03 TaxID=3075400 RepID=UPI002AD5700F|nr:hypothetical protein [Nostoc sp. DedSLP03]MDZ7965147.1 hypothetical protein [Nostoc sp. DedSLP03]
MKKIVVAAIFSLIAGSTSLLFPQAAKADRVVYCRPVIDNRVLNSAANHPNAYTNGFREGQQSARNREAYKPRTVGGEFARGFQDGYLNLPYAGQENVVPRTIVQHTTQICDDDGYTVAPSPVYIYNPYPIYVSPYPTYGINFGFGRGFHFGFGGGFHGWGHHRRW